MTAKPQSEKDIIGYRLDSRFRETHKEAGIKNLHRRNLILGSAAAAGAAALSMPSAGLAQTDWTCAIIVAYRNGAPVQVTAAYSDGELKLFADKNLLSTTTLRDTPTELVKELHDPSRLFSYGFLKINKTLPKCGWSLTAAQP